MSESPNAKLIAELRKVAALYRHAGHPHGIEPLLDSAADALEAADARNAELEAERDEHKERSSGRFQAYRAKKIELAAALTVIEQARKARGNHPECAEHPDGDVISCGWKRAVLDIDAALANPYRANPEPKEGEG